MAVCPPPPCPPTQTIAQILSANCQASSFVNALKKAGLFDTLSGPGPFTVFAPTNAAFCRVSPCTLNGWADDGQTLTSALQYHIAYGRLTAFDLAKLNTLGTLEGAPLTLVSRINGSRMVLNGAGHVCGADVVACNGIIHYVDTVLTPPVAMPAGANGIVSSLAGDQQYTTTAKLIDAAGLTDTITQTGPITFFAPTNAALSKLPCGVLDQLMRCPDQLRQALLYNIVPGTLAVAQLASPCPVNNFLGVPFTTMCIGQSVKINNTSRVVALNNLSGNSIYQGIDYALLPPSMQLSALTPASATAAVPPTSTTAALPPTNNNVMAPPSSPNTRNMPAY